jgi:DNA modification methylase
MSNKILNNEFINKVINADCREIIPSLDNNSIDLFLSDIPYGINLDEWDVLHNNTNSALLGSSPAQLGKSGFKRRGKPINGWNEADKNIGKEYYEWCLTWTKLLFPKMKEGSSVFIFGARRTIHQAILAMEDGGFLLRDLLIWNKKNAHHRAQKISITLERRGLKDEAEKWAGWRLGNLAPITEPIAWFFKPYKKTITDNLLKNNLGAMNIEGTKKYVQDHTNLLDFSFGKNEQRYHEAQKPISINEFLIELTTIEGQTVLDSFVGSGTTAVAAKNTKRNFIAIEANKQYADIARKRLEEKSPIKTTVKQAIPVPATLF